VLVVAPHPDDDVITAAGITYNRANTVVAYMTNGDSHTEDRQGTVTAVAGPTRFTDAAADFSAVPDGVSITVTKGGVDYQRTLTVVNSTTIEINSALPAPGLAIGDTYDTAAFIPIGIAETRQGEAVTAQQILGRVENDLIFLGYPDFKLTDVWNTASGAVTGGTGRTQTYASRGLGRTDWHNFRNGGHADYNQPEMLADVVDLIQYVRPDHVFTTGPEDGTADHRTTYTVVKAAIEQVHANDPTYGAVLHSTVVWQNPFSTCLNNLWPLDYSGSGQPQPYTDPSAINRLGICGISQPFTPDWADRDVYNVPSALMSSNTSTNPKYRAIEAHASQGGMSYGSYIARFFHSEEYFWAEAIPASAATDDGPYTVDQGKKIDVNGVLDNDTGLGLTAEKVTNPLHASSFILNPNGTFSYTHDGSATTSDSFTYRAVDAAGTATIATVTITIIPDIVPPPEPPPPGGPVHSIVLVDPGQGLWHLYDRNGVEKASFFFGNPGDYPIYGDWNCDGIETPGMYRQSDGYVYLRNTNTQGPGDIRFFFGNPGDVPLAGDFNGDGCDTVSIYRPSEARAFIINKLGANDGGLGAADVTYFFGNPGDKPFVGDFDGNGTETVGLHRESTGFVYFRNSHTQGVADSSFFFGDPGDRLVAGDWNNNGAFSPALFRPSNTTMYFRYTNTQGNADKTWSGGQSSWIPVSGYNSLG
jgi:LmbE family N-acetylglucosaminyl deacetylase